MKRGSGLGLRVASTELEAPAINVYGKTVVDASVVRPCVLKTVVGAQKERRTEYVRKGLRVVKIED